VFRLPREIHDTVRNGMFRPGPDETYGDGDDSAWMTVDWLALTRRERLFGHELNFIDTGGDKPPLLLVHGLSGSWQNWLLNIPSFMDTHRVVAPDLPGFGGSELPEGPISIRDFARVLDALCDRIGVESPVVVGNSMGGFVGAELALAFPTRVPRLVLVSAAGLSTENLRREPTLTAARLLQVTETRTAARRKSVIRRPRLRRLVLQSIFRYPEKLSRPLLWEQLQGSGKPGFVPALEALMTYSFRDRLAQIECPTLIVWGRNDMLVTVRDAERYERLIGSNARKVIFEDTGHVAMLERPSRFNALLREFLAGAPAPEVGVEGVTA
jgi:pimeloyl-ACP methyl ester carboxylesterase